MSKKFEIIGTAFVVTDTISSKEDIFVTARDVFFSIKSLNKATPKIDFYSTISGNQIGNKAVFPSLLLSECVDSSLTPFTKSTFIDFCTANLGKSSLGTGAGLTNVVDINTASDFPPAVGGVRELVQTPGVAITYRFGAVQVDMGSDRFTITGGDVVFLGMHRTESTLISTTSGVFITCVDSSFFPEFIGFNCPNAKIVDFTVPTASFKSFVCDNVIARECDTVFDITDSFTTSLRTLTIVIATSGGINWSGTNNNLNVSNTLALTWAGNLFDLGTAIFDIIVLDSGNRYVSPAGATILSGATGSANLTATGIGLVSGNVFNGTGTALDGIDTMDLQWQFTGNTFADGTTLNSRQLSDAFLTSTKTVTIGSTGVYVPIGGVNWSSDISDRFTVGIDGLITYIGLRNIEIEVTATATIELSGGGSDKICIKIAIEGVVKDKTMACTKNNTATGVSSIGLFTISTGNTIQLFVGNEENPSNIDVSEATLIVKGA